MRIPVLPCTPMDKDSKIDWGGYGNPLKEFPAIIEPGTGWLIGFVDGSWYSTADSGEAHTLWRKTQRC